MKQRILLAALILSFCVSCKKDVNNNSLSTTTPLYAQITGDSSIAVFNAAVQKSGDSKLFLGTDSVTVLVPTNAAFLSQGVTLSTIAAMSQSQADSLVRYHYINAPVHLVTGSYSAFNSLLGPAVYGFGNTDGSNNYFNGANAVVQSLPGSNAVLYKLSEPLSIPASSVQQLLAADSSLSYFSEALKTTGFNLAPANGWSTVLVPDNNAFIAAGYPTLASIDSANTNTLTALLQYHVIAGQYFSNTFNGMLSVNSEEGGSINITANNSSVEFTGTGNTNPAMVTGPDRIAGTNIIVQKINEVLFP
jgi:uncharacterized surface protein with fasciclin (FAS1) repeats